MLIFFNLKNEFYPCKTFAYIYLRYFYECKNNSLQKGCCFFPCMNSAEEYMGPCMKNYGRGGVVVVCYTATFSVVMQRSSPQTASEN